MVCMILKTVLISFSENVLFLSASSKTPFNCSISWRVSKRYTSSISSASASKYPISDHRSPYVLVPDTAVLSVSFAVIKCLIRTVDAVLYPVRFLVGVKSQSQRAGEFPVRMVDPGNASTSFRIRSLISKASSSVTAKSTMRNSSPPHRMTLCSLHCSSKMLAMHTSAASPAPSGHMYH